MIRKFFILICICVIPTAGFCLDITAGATAWYVWGSRYENMQKKSIRKNSDYAFDPTFLYGPALSVKLNNDFNVTFVYLYSKFNHIENIYKDEGGNYFVKSKIKRSDSDLAINYRLNDYLKLFLGAKYLAYEINASYDDMFYGKHYYSSSKHSGIGPGLGLNCTYPIIYNIFLLSTISGFYLFSPGEKFEDYGLYDRVHGGRPGKMTIGYNEYGINTNISAAYYIAEWSTAITLGIRFQYFVTDYYEYEPFFINDIKNMFFGLTLTATYTFSL